MSDLYQKSTYFAKRQRSLVRLIYFNGGRKAPICDSKLLQQKSLDLGFTIGQVREIVTDGVSELLKDKIQKVLATWLETFDWELAFRLLTLTLILEPDPNNSSRYAFLLHIFPRELYRLYGKTDPTLDKLIIDTADEFTQIMEIQ